MSTGTRAKRPFMSTHRRRGESSARTYARTFGIGGLVVASVGFVPWGADLVHAATGWHFELGENVVHAALGVWGTVAGFRSPAPVPRSLSRPHAVRR